MTPEEILESNKHIPDKEVLQDIKDTEREIAEFKDKIERRERFIEKLKMLLKLRHPD